MEVRGSAGAAARRDGLGAGDPARDHAGRHGRLVARGDPRRPRRRARARVGAALRGSAGRPAAGRAGRRRRSRRPGTARASPGRRQSNCARAIACPCSAVAPSCCAVQAIVCSERHSVSPSSMIPCRCQASCASTSTAIVGLAPVLAAGDRRCGRCTRAPSRAAPRRARRARRTTACGSSSRRAGVAVGVEAHAALDDVPAEHAPERPGAVHLDTAARRSATRSRSAAARCPCGPAGRRATTPRRATHARRRAVSFDPQRRRRVHALHRPLRYRRAASRRLDSCGARPE